jgi:hypothetical protein
MAGRTYNPNAQIFKDQVVIQDSTASSKTGGALVVSGGFSALDTSVTGHVQVNNVKITPNLNDILYELQAVLSPATNEPSDIVDFRFLNAKCNGFKANVNVTVSGASSKYALWEINGVYKPTGWVITTLFTGDLTGVDFYIRNDLATGYGQMQYTNSNGIGTTTTIRFRATTTAPAGSDPTNGESVVVNNTSGSYIANKLLYTNAVDNVANVSDLDFTSNVFTVAGGSRTVMQSTSEFTNLTNGGALTIMGDASVAKKMVVGTRVGIANTAPSFQLDVSGDINFTGNFYKNGNIYSGSSVWETSGQNVFYTQGNLGVGTTAPSYRLDVAGSARVSQDLIVSANATITGPGLTIPSGNTASRPGAPVAGQIRYNSEYSQFEGFGAGNAWGSLGGVADLAQTTKILASSSPSVTDGNLYFYNVSQESMRITSTGNVGIATSAPGHKLDVNGGINATSMTSGSGRITNLSGTASTIASMIGTDLLVSNATATNLVGTAATIGFLTASSIGASIISAGSLHIGGTLTVVNITSTNVLNTNVSAGNIFVSTSVIATGNSNTMGAILTTGGNVGIGVDPSYKLHVSGDIFATGNVTAFSDQRLKTDVVTIGGALDKTKQLRGVYYTHNEERGVGVIAQEIQQVLPEVVATKGEYLGVAYGNIAGLLIEAIKELSAKVERLERDQH